MTVPAEFETFRFEGLHGEVNGRYRPADLEGEIRRIIDPAAAAETVHWGRNYLYRTFLELPDGRVDVVVKQFRNQGLRARLRRRLKGSKAHSSWVIAQAFQGAGIPTAEPVLLVESDAEDGPSFFVTRNLDTALEARYLLRAANAGLESEQYPGLDFESFITATGQVLRRMHAAGFFHRDLSIGNVLLTRELEPDPWVEGAGDRAESPGPLEVGPDDLCIIDLNRTRRRRRLRLGQRHRDLCRLAIFRPEHQELFLRAYWGEGPSAWQWFLYRLYHRGFLFKIEGKKSLRARTRRVLDLFKPRRAHAHIPEAPAEASNRDKIVWDYLSDQPHQHASKFEKLQVRLLDAPSHLIQNAAFLAAMPRIWRRYRALRQQLHTQPVPWRGVGVCVRPHPEDPETLLRMIDDLGVRHVLLRLHPWDEDHDAEEALAAALHRRGIELTFALPQVRDLVRDPERWRRSVELLVERFVPYGRYFQVGQAVNRSKWGIWKTSEYFDLTDSALEILRRHPEVEVLGPAVIDFEVHVTAALLNLRRCPRLDILGSLLYVDRRGAPENTQLGFDTTGKILLLQAIAETGRHPTSRSWITEVNWPLWEGPHSPAGKSVSVDEQSQADFLARFYLLALITGAVERVFWWQIIARGYGLVAPKDGDAGGLRRRPAFHALATLQRELADSTFIAPLPAPAECHLLHFETAEGGTKIVGWSVDGIRTADLPRTVTGWTEQAGDRHPCEARTAVELRPSVRYFE